jgi:ribose transport system substrate-binding protein
MIGCQNSGGTTANGGTSSTGKDSGKRLKIGVSIPSADHGWTAGVKYWADQATKLHPEIDWTVETAATPAEQVNDLETMMSAGMDGVVVLATESAAITPTAKSLKDRGVFIVNVDRGFTEPYADIFLEGDNAAFGRKSAEYMVNKLNGNGKIIVLEGIPSTVNTARVQAFKTEIAKYPGIQILASGAGMWNKEKATNVMQALLPKYPTVDAVWASDDDMALGAEIAIKDAGRQDAIWMLGGAGMKDVVKRVMDGDKMFPADITYPPSMIAAGIEMAATALEGGNLDEKKKYLPKHIVLDVDLITPDNAKDYYFPDSIY